MTYLIRVQHFELEASPVVEIIGLYSPSASFLLPLNETNSMSKRFCRIMQHTFTRGDMVYFLSDANRNTFIHAIRKHFDTSMFAHSAILPPEISSTISTLPTITPEIFRSTLKRFGYDIKDL